ncbi:sugar-binding transcriptional regulator [Lederbergia citrea]|uniref:Sugar-binding transcriptional regulator n=1 Tax=Lederbergia citrea TaxID=2833581 RepID=A0A942Z6W0_9BACI|nr:sugar-binding transcriptional regulator [Lederbergia citrea]MBS4179406.1 sugar-binding transcriptional regulator [Lederbergia citrea]MBS4206075.1 sugar-binding transcriptional regulator [Lederbergia citrea]MBS4224476.1 sugar-binding transcriptional regulator [Lederbergia citrea]
MTSDKKRLVIEVARLYYQFDYTQQEIAKKLGVSRPTVSRLLQQAKDQGFVKIKIIDPFTNNNELSKSLQTKYHLDEVKIAYATVEEDREILQVMSEVTAKYLYEVVKDGDVLGVTWGTTMHRVALQLKQKPVKGVEVIQLKGGVGHSHVNTYESETVYLFAEAFNTIPRYLPLPVIVDNPMVKEVIESDRHMSRLIDLGKQANIAIFTVGPVDNEAPLFRLGYLSPEEKSLLQSEAVGDICSRFFTREGDICSPSINERTIGIELEELKQKENSILVAGGTRKVEAIHGALLGGYANVFITDQYTAQSLLLHE